MSEVKIQDTKLYEVNILYKNGVKQSIRVKMDNKALSNHLGIIGMCYKENQPGYLLLNGIFIRISDTCQIETKEVPPTSK